MVSHLALPKLKPGGFKLERQRDEFVIAHIGTMMVRRRPDLLLTGALLAMERHPEIRFLQFGDVDAEILKLCLSIPPFSGWKCVTSATLSPRDAADFVLSR